MDIYLKIIVGILVSIIMCLVLEKENKYLSILLIIFACCAAIIAATNYIKPIITFFKKLEVLGALNEGLLNTLMKAIGVGFLGEISNLICLDSGNASLGKVIQLSSTVVMLWIAIPLMTELIELVEKILVSV